MKGHGSELKAEQPPELVRGSDIHATAGHLHGAGRRRLPRRRDREQQGRRHRHAARRRRHRVQRARLRPLHLQSGRWRHPPLGRRRDGDRRRGPGRGGHRGYQRGVVAAAGLLGARHRTGHRLQLEGVLRCLRRQRQERRLGWRRRPWKRRHLRGLAAGAAAVGVVARLASHRDQGFKSPTESEKTKT